MTRPEPTDSEPDDGISKQEAEEIGRLYAAAIEGFQDLGTFQLRLSNMMTYRSYNWDIDEFRSVLKQLDDDSLSSLGAMAKRMNDAREASDDGHIVGDIWEEDGALHVKTSDGIQELYDIDQ